jgi:hypothetical protein
MMVATSVGGSITGKGGNRLVLDDPHNPMQAESDLQRAQAIDLFTHTLGQQKNRRDFIAKATAELLNLVRNNLFHGGNPHRPENRRLCRVVPMCIRCSCPPTLLISARFPQ